MGNIYLAVKQLIDAFALNNKQGFKQVVMVEWPRKGVYSVGFLTNENPRVLSSASGEDLVSLFIPTVPNPTTGFFVTVPKGSIRVLDVSVEDGFKMMISSGVWLPDDGSVGGAEPQPGDGSNT